MIYFIQLPTGSIKIGTTVNLDRRLQSLSSSYRGPVALLATMPGGRAEEAELHSRFAAHRMGRTEQFRPSRDVMDFIDKPLLVHPDPEAVEVTRPATILVRVDKDVAQLAAIVAAYRNTQQSDLLTEILRPLLQKMHAQEVAKARPKD